MSRFHSYVNTARSLIETYAGEQPLAGFLKHFFVLHRKYGSKDRKLIASLCYQFFRLGKAASDMPVDERILLGEFLCRQEPTDLMEDLRPAWNEKITLPLPRKFKFLANKFSPADIFPFQDELSAGIDAEAFCKSFLAQPDLFLRLRPQTRAAVIRKLEKSKLNWQLEGEDCVRLNLSEKIEDLFVINKELVVQDYNSQKVLDFIKTEKFKAALPGDAKTNPSVWDCCAASGGKSILADDILNGKIDLTVSDVRASIILSLHQRFQRAGIKEYKYFIADITSAGFKPGDISFDMIICDAPCTGSGTWTRTPEQLCFFKTSSINEYQQRQKKIVTGALPYLKPGGFFFYITCSIFKKENEDLASFICENLNCELVEATILKGYDKKADNMFTSVFRKKN